MFSQFRQAVESLAQPLQDNPSSPDPPTRSQSPQLAENALVNLRKSVASQRIASPVQQNPPRSRSASPGPSSTSTRSVSDSGLRKTTLEERLRASFAASEASAAPTPRTVSVTQHPLSPTWTPVSSPPNIDSAPTTPLALDLPHGGSVQDEEPGHINGVSSPPQEFNPPQPPTVTSPTDPQPESISSGTRTDDRATHTSTSVPQPNGVQPPSVIPPTDPQPDSTSSGAHTVTVSQPNDAAQPPGVTPLADPLPDLAASSIHTDDTADPSVGITLTQEAPEITEPQQPPIQECTQAAETVGVSSPPTDPSGEESLKPELEPTTATEQSKDADVETLQERLKLVEQRFADVSTSFKKLQIERRGIDGVITELTPLEGSKDVTALREYLINVNTKLELSQDELQRLNGKLTRQEERLEELRDTHSREIISRLDQIEKLRSQLTEAEALLTASQSTASQTAEDNAKRDAEIEHLRAEVSKANEFAKEEEEKRVKAISLLKTVRQKLVKAEKERDDGLRELNETRERSLEEKEKERAERANLAREVDVVNAEREKAVAGLRAQFDKDFAATKDRAERDIQTLRKQFDAEVSAQKTSHSTEISAQKLRIGTLENTVANLSGENKSFFEQLEMRQAELESSQCHNESLQAQNTELQFQLKELQERITLLTDEVHEVRGEHEMRSQVSGVSAEEISQLVSSIEIKYEAKLSELRRTLSTAEKERTEAEATWSRKLTEKTKETEELKHLLRSSAQLREQDEDKTGALQAEIEKLQIEARSQYDRLHELQTHMDASKDVESILHRRLSETASRADDSEKQLEESQSKETQLRTQNKTLRDELRKVQNSVAVLERQRKPGAGYWNRSEVSESRTSISSISDAPSPSSPPLAKNMNDEDINYEYLRNVILQFLEHKEMRPNLVRVLSTILRFTPQETRRLMSKV